MEKIGTGQEVSQKHDSPESDGSSGKRRAYEVPPFANCCSACLFFDTEDCYGTDERDPSLPRAPGRC